MLYWIEDHLSFNLLCFIDTSDLHFISTKNGLCGHNLIKNGFSYLWAGARANKGAKGGKIGYEMKVTPCSLYSH